MYSLLIDTHDKNVLLVLYKNGKVLDLINKESNMRHSEITMPSLIEMVEKKGIKVQDLSEIFTVVGPGSFTGVRIGVVIAKTIAYLLNIPIKPLSSLDMEYFSNDMKNGIYRLDEKNGYFVCEYGCNDPSNGEIRYYSKKEYNEKFNQIEVNENIQNDYEKIYNYMSNISKVNPHLINPLYIKQIEVLK